MIISESLDTFRFLNLRLIDFFNPWTNASLYDVVCAFKFKSTSKIPSLWVQEDTSSDSTIFILRSIKVKDPKISSNGKSTCLLDSRFFNTFRDMSTKHQFRLYNGFGIRGYIAWIFLKKVST